MACTKPKRECGQMAPELQRDLYLKKLKNHIFDLEKSLENCLDVFNDVPLRGIPPAWLVLR
jgi:hypothetical protein